MSYTEEQEMFLLATLSNFGQGCWGDTIEFDISNNIQEQLKAWFPTGWEIVWGPAVFVAKQTSDSSSGPGPTNVMFAAYDKTRATYFISVAGTNSGSLFDLVEDLKVNTLEPWAYGSGSENGNIASGSNLGLTVLQGMKPVKGLRGEEKTLADFLSQDLPGRRDDGDVRVITGGHSLGGALSPLLGLWLLDTKDDWDEDHIVDETRFSCWRFAGPTPGDSAFATYYDGRMPNTISLMNYLDVISKWWDHMDEILGLYTSDEPNEPDIKPGVEITKLVTLMTKMAEGKGYTQIGQLKILRDAIVDPAYISTCEGDCANFTKQMGYQHVRAYFTLLGLPLPFELGVEQFSKICVQAGASEHPGNTRRNRR